MKRNTPVQITNTNLDVSLVGCIGIVVEDKTPQSVVGFYMPGDKGHKPKVSKATFNDTDLTEIGKLKFNPNP